MKPRRWWPVIGLIGLIGTTALAQSGSTITFFGPVNQDGCPFCCEFLCQLTPTPTPEIDGAGRQVFTRSTGNVLLIVEARPGTSGVQPDTQGSFDPATDSLVAITHPSGLPGLQMLAERDLGTGTLAVCDTEFPNIGGVPGVASLDFDSGELAANAMVDVACRFEFNSTGSRACTKNPFGDFDHLMPNTTRQFCFQIPQAAAFHVGETVVALRMRDQNGNLGPRKEIVIRVGQPGGTNATPTPTPTPGSTVAGRIRYYSADRAVSAATVRVIGAVQQNTGSNASGNYSFTSLPQANIEIRPEKVGDLANGVTSLDAAYALQASVGDRALTSLQRLACDVTGNGSVSSLDATRILQFRVGTLASFAVADVCQSDWAFVPMPGPAANQRLIQPQMSLGSCQRGAIALEPLAGNPNGQDFFGVLFGDCTGNWQPGGGGTGAVQSPVGYGPIVRLGGPRKARAGRVRLPVYVDSREDFQAMDLQVVYDPTFLRVRRVRRMRAARGAIVQANTDFPGLVVAAMASGRPITASDGPLLVLEFYALRPAAVGASVRMWSASVDDQSATIAD